MHPTIPEYYTNQIIFVTGGSGFIGKVLIEKLLRSCPDLKKIYVLLRSKKGKTCEERIKTITDLPLFDVVRKENPAQFEKLHLVEGDCSQLRLGLSVSSEQKVLNETNIIFHGAASVRFDDPLDQAVLLNTRGTRELALLAQRMPKLQVFVHISTTYCNTDRPIIDERLYPAHADWQKTIKIVENADRNVVNVLTKKYIAPLPNTYTFAKSLAEHAVHDLCENKIPLVVFRPSIVISSAREPFPGWIDNFNGPIGLLVASGKGVVRSVYAKPDINADYVPVDLVAKALIIAAWKKANEESEEKSVVTFYNGSNNGINPCTIGEIAKMGTNFVEKLPFNNIFWYPVSSVTKCYHLHMIKVFLFQLIPALFVDGLLHVTGHKTMLLRIHRKIYVANKAVSYFLEREWTFLNANSVDLEKALQSSDVEAFGFEMEKLQDRWDYFYKAALGARNYLLHETDDKLPQAIIHVKRMWYVAQLFNALWYLSFIWIAYKLDIVGQVEKKFTDGLLFFTEN